MQRGNRLFTFLRHLPIGGRVRGHYASALVVSKMANDEEREALLGVAEKAPRLKIKSLYESEQVLGRHSPYRAEEEGIINICATNSLQILSEADHIVAVFVVAFDTKAG